MMKFTSKRRNVFFIIYCFFFAFTLAGCEYSPQSDISEDEKLNAFFQTSFDAVTERNVLFPEYIGTPGVYDQWQNLSQEYAEETYALRLKIYEELESFSKDQLSWESQINYDVYANSVGSRIEEHQFRFHHWPISQFATLYSQPVVHLMNVHKIDSVLTAKAYITRLNGIRTYLKQHQENIERSLNMGVVPPYFALESVIPSIEKILVGRPYQPDADEDTLLLKNFKEKVTPLDIPDAKKAELIAEAEQALLHSFRPAYLNFIEFMRPVVAQSKGKPAQGVWALPDGEEYYRYMLKTHTTLDITAEEIHQTGLNEIARIHNEIRELIKTLNFEGSLKDFFQYTIEDPKFYYEKTEQGREEAIADAQRYIDGMYERLEEAFITMPKTSVEVKVVPSFMEASSGIASYSAGASDGSRPGIFYINLYNPKELPKWQMAALAYHEAIPGHHMQFSIAQTLQGLPEFRKYAFFTAFSEGWGLYSEFMPKEMEFYSDPYEDYGRLALELLRACRLVADTGIHYKRWTEEQTIDFLMENMPISRERATRSARRYFVMPGQATAYKVGMMKILELRQRAKEKLGDLFDIRAFNETVLTNGAVPLAVLEVILNDWLDERLANASPESLSP